MVPGTTNSFSFVSPSFVPGTSDHWKLSFLVFLSCSYNSTFTLTCLCSFHLFPFYNFIPGGEEAERGQVNNTESLESDGSQIGYGVIWGEQITNTLNKLRSLTFFSVGAEPIPAPPPVPREPRSKRKPRGSQPSRRAQGGRKPKNPKPKLFSRNYEGK